jgi:arsenate reductase (thioredoxin)
MAEGFCRHLWGTSFNVYSAGTKKHGMNERAMKVMKEVGIDLSTHYSKTVDELPAVTFDYVVTVCDSASENCPFFPGGKIIHIGFEDPPALTKNMTNEEEILKVYRRVRDEIHASMKNLMTIIGEK